MEQAAGIVLLLIAVALVIQLMRAGPDGAREWIRAKFLGQTKMGATGHAAGSTSSTSTSSTSGGGSIVGGVGNVLLNPGFGLSQFTRLLGG